MAEVTLNFTAEQIDLRLENAGNAILHAEQTLTPEQQAQALKNLGAETGVPVVLNLADYGIDFSTPLLAGGGAAIYEDVGSFWEDVNKVKPGQALLLYSEFSGLLVVPTPAMLYFKPIDSGYTVYTILSTLTFYYGSQLLMATSYIAPHGTSGAELRVAIIGSATLPNPE
jgi:hypothetical protein